MRQQTAGSVSKDQIKLTQLFYLPQVQNTKLPALHRPVLNRISAYLLGMRTLAAGASTSLLPLGNTANSVIFMRGEWSINCSHTAMTPAATAEPVSSASDSCKHHQDTVHLGATEQHAMVPMYEALPAPDWCRGMKLRLCLASFQLHCIMNAAKQLCQAKVPWQ